MLPSLIAQELRASLTSFLATTFALADDDVRGELERFIGDEQNGVFRGPYVRLRLPFRPAFEGWRDLVQFAPVGFLPHRHQAQAWERLSSLSRTPRPTLITTGTGSGKTESFLVPLLDHCARHLGTPGVKAIVLYPMNALANDQARRIAAMIHAHQAEIGGVRVGLYTGDSPDTATMSDTGVIGSKYEMRKSPPDILLTNYKMLDMLLLRSEDKELFAGARVSLRYLVLDEFHTYDGAQGTDVAMLLRRLGMALSTAGDDGPLTGVTPVATSATLGSDGASAFALREFAETVFGTPFDADSLVGEDRLTPTEWVDAPVGTVPLLDRVTAALEPCTSHAEVVDAAARVFLGHDHDDEVALGSALRAHPLTRRLVEVAVESRPLVDVAEQVEPGWSARPLEAQAAVSAFLGLLSEARSEDTRPLLGVDVQLWLREVRRVVRRLDLAPRFEWYDGTTADDGQFMAALYCRHCGRSGWGTAAKIAGGYTIQPDTVWRAALLEQRLQRAWIFAPGEGAVSDPRVQWADSATGDLSRESSGKHTNEVPVLVTPDDDSAKHQRCPACGLDDGLRFLGSSVATLASAALGQVFASPDIETAQKKTLVFTDSVQDASHRASFIESRAYALNRRSLLLRAVHPAGCTLGDIGEGLVATAQSAEERYAVLPPDLKTHESFHRYWAEDVVEPGTRAKVVKLMNFGAILEFGLSARVGRTLELTGAATAHVDVDSLSDLVVEAIDAAERGGTQVALDVDGLPSQLEFASSDRSGTVAWARGVLERMRLQGGIEHPWLAKYMTSGGNRHSIWGGRPRREGMPAFPARRPAPSFPTTARHSDAFDTILGVRGWYAQWTARALHVPTVDAWRYIRALLDGVEAAGVLNAVQAEDRSRVWCIKAERVRVQRTTGPVPTALRCPVCSTVMPANALVVDQLAGAPCMRIGCTGVYEPGALEVDYYRELYRAGRVRRIVAHEHTSLLKPEIRVALEQRFKQTVQQASDPNVLTCTPTLELGIDIGDLSMVALTSLPRSTASYLQRVGRAGRLTGSSLVLALLPARPLELQRLVDPLTMIAGNVVPPACYLDAVEILRRQYLASLVDRQARSESPRPIRRAVDVFAGGLEPTSWLGRLVADARANADVYVQEFLAGFGDSVTKETAADLARWAGVNAGGDVPDLERAVERACKFWLEETAELQIRQGALNAEAERLETLPSLDDAQKRDLKRVRGELGAIRHQLSARRTAYWISVLEELGLLPNYALLDDTTRLDVGLWWTDEETGAAERSDDAYLRGSTAALRELAPGATFYVNGTSVEIDGVDLGSARNPATERRRFCPSCGWSGPVTAVAKCPRCDDPAAGDTGQILNTLPFRKASAYASRELAQRDDDTDDRRRAVFTVRTTVDADPADVTSAWGLSEYQFGAEVLRRADIRWINLGLAARRGAAFRMAGEEDAAPLFEACTSCGVVWSAQRGVHSPLEARHRGWCPQRKSPRADGWTTVVLTHHLRTQAVRLLVPPVVLVDPTLLTSFRAALLLGLREVLGGDPDHLDVVVAVDPSPGSVDRWAMVLHDTVPGGTGYLARFSEPEEVQRLLQAALDVLVSCPCREESAAACHRCLLPHVPPFRAQEARRDRAAELLTDILADWTPQRIDSLRSIVVGAHDTPIERRFRNLLVRWAKARGATVSAHTTNWGDRVELTFPAAHGGIRWKLTPQVSHSFVKPDFDLTTDDPDVPTIAVFCDGVRFHASTDHNRIADDAVKRQELREQGLLVWAVTHRDLDAYEAALDGASVSSHPEWATPAMIDKATGYGTALCQAGDISATSVFTDPISILTAFLLRPDPIRWEPAARCAALGLASGLAANGVVQTSSGALPALVRAGIVGDHVTLPEGDAQLLIGRTSGGAALGLRIGSQTDLGAVLAVDDRDGVVGDEAHLAAWRDWLSLGNVLQFLAPGHVVATSLAALPADPTTAMPVSIDPRWRELEESFDGPTAALVRALAESGAPIPEAGLEVADGDYIVDLAWQGEQLAVVLGEDLERDGWLNENGWTLAAADADAIRVALALKTTEA